MSVYKKLQQARMLLQNTKLSKSGKNKFAGYEYFELGDFLPAIQKICNDVGLCGVVSFNKDDAYLVIYNTEGDDFVTFTSPMSSAALKGCHDVQNLGAVQTYLRRYLWTNAFEIVEHDALDATTGSVEPVAKAAPKPVIKTVNGNPVDENLRPIKPIVGDKGPDYGKDFKKYPKNPDGGNLNPNNGWVITVEPKPASELDTSSWLANIKDAAHMLLDLTESEEDVMAIFKKNKVLFDTVKATDATFFKEMMAKFTEVKNQFIKE